jgi:hypothetical protein
MSEKSFEAAFDIYVPTRNICNGTYYRKSLIAAFDLSCNGTINLLWKKV